MLALYAPSECTYELIHGEGIDHGGHVEIIHRESKHVADISKKVRKLLEGEQKSRLKAAKLEVRLQQDQNALKNQRTIFPPTSTHLTRIELESTFPKSRLQSKR